MFKDIPLIYDIDNPLQQIKQSATLEDNYPNILR